MSDLSLLMDMGFPQEKAEKALSVTGNKGVEAAMEWLLAHSSSTETSEKNSAAVGDIQTDGAMEVNLEEPSKTHNVQDISEELNLQAKSLQCDECNKKFRTDSEVEFHAVKTGHQKFSESCEEVRAFTEEEKKERLKKVEDIIKQRRVEKAEQEQKEALEKEKSRRKTGQELTHVRQKLLEDEMKQLAEMKRREKLEEKQAKQRVLEQIERDKEARRLKFGMAGATPAATAAPIVAAPEPVPAVPPKTYEECRIQVRMTNGACLTHTFSPKEPLSAVRLFVEMNRTDGEGPFGLMTNFPKKVFNDDDMNSPLSVLGLVPSAVLIVCKPQ